MKQTEEAIYVLEGQIDNMGEALAQMKRTLDNLKMNLRLEESSRSGLLQSVHGGHHVGADGGRDQDPARHPRDGAQRTGSVSDQDAEQPTDSGATRGELRRGGVRRPPDDLPPAAARLTIGAFYRVTEGRNAGRWGELERVEVGTFDKLYCTLVLTEGATISVRDTDITLLHGPLDKSAPA